MKPGDRIAVRRNRLSPFQRDTMSKVFPIGIIEKMPDQDNCYWVRFYRIKAPNDKPFRVFEFPYICTGVSVEDAIYCGNETNISSNLLHGWKYEIDWDAVNEAR